MIEWMLTYSWDILCMCRWLASKFLSFHAAELWKKDLCDLSEAAFLKSQWEHPEALDRHKTLVSCFFFFYSCVQLEALQHMCLICGTWELQLESLLQTAVEESHWGFPFLPKQSSSTAALADALCHGEKPPKTKTNDHLCQRYCLIASCICRTF